MNLTVLDKIKAYKLVEIENDKKVKSRTKQNQFT